MRVQIAGQSHSYNFIINKINAANEECLIVWVETHDLIRSFMEFLWGNLNQGKRKLGNPWKYKKALMSALSLPILVRGTQILEPRPESEPNH